jgi:hypothetical protein
MRSIWSRMESGIRMRLGICGRVVLDIIGVY